MRYQRYEDTSAGWAGWLESSDGRWVAFVGLDGDVMIVDREA